MVNSVGKNMAASINRPNDVTSVRLHKASSIDPQTMRAVRVANLTTSAASGDDLTSPLIDIGHVGKIKAQIDTGTYSIDADQLARDMLDWGKVTD